ncbi:hypothetical protein T310_7523 [Rasamsonia emersonii CBS 393.64]|uniref:Uncharacterized protein n=1 Tax=Rasamsonia emersonii (strain ATCC 16479 / CBS 393.64 / IMI 116815) TaxID=1408163 RepID=A0A0F4YJX3_RASE3|nr:hypothetical protein T310_7523 [Rasamsonia emersonii CBS 393.64]KKA18529.1 hypothetical protein T310_7523 [Rasamsonia emersonii CBS 393.64]
MKASFPFMLLITSFALATPLNQNNNNNNNLGHYYKRQCGCAACGNVINCNIPVFMMVVGLVIALSSATALTYGVTAIEPTGQFILNLQETVAWDIASPLKLSICIPVL